MAKFKSKTQEEFLSAARAQHGDKYDYSLVNYTNGDEQIPIICLTCPGKPIFYQRAKTHIRGSSCKDCVNRNKTTTKKSFIKRAVEIHGNKYDYSLVNYVDATTKIEIICKVKGHPSFWQTPNKHTCKRGCPICGKLEGDRKQSSNTKAFIIKVKEIYGDTYDYSLVDYINNNTLIKIICKNGHGIFERKPSGHLNYKECPACFPSRSNISKGEKEWLNYINISDECWQKKIYIGNDWYRPDAYDTTTNTICEYYGDYWHGNPVKFESDDLNVRADKTFQELYDATMEREQLILSAGYNLITIWESDWLIHKKLQKYISKLNQEFYSYLSNLIFK
jgi:hypothetical protein